MHYMVHHADLQLPQTIVLKSNVHNYTQQYRTCDPRPVTRQLLRGLLDF